MSQTFNNLIKFPLPQEIVDYWSNTILRDRISDNYLQLRVNRSDYTLVTEGGLETKRGYKSIYGESESKRIGFRLRVRSQVEDLYLLLLELANSTIGECELTPIEVIDYCYIHNRLDRDQGYRLRRGVFEGEFSEASGSVTQGFIDCQGNENITGNRYSSGFSFKFMEVDVLNGYF